ncbi:hypothetical protein LF909_06140 [Bifidobacterium pseudolongum]|nr:hypothetical protein [Bifidobacterium pseudolongum]HJE56410.1 hypothetical protein [Bifidobacterium pseudolongum subsp. globosum]MCH4842957.1 hypothetical protein [Bifidobacterium pseudolongum]MCH4850086.1 hypothetical protein [Bifidobacterium pseudolongum]MCH4851712.1 hypothetical protein [Bifidobacterium pseudolongum]
MPGRERPSSAGCRRCGRMGHMSRNRGCRRTGWSPAGWG